MSRRQTHGYLSGCDYKTPVPTEICGGLEETDLDIECAQKRSEARSKQFTEMVKEEAVLVLADNT